MIYTTNTINKYNNTYHNTIKMKPVNVKSSMYIHSRKEINNKDPKFKIPFQIYSLNVTKSSRCTHLPGCSFTFLFELEITRSI